MESDGMECRTLTANIVLEMGYASGLHQRSTDRDSRSAVRVHPDHKPFLYGIKKEG